VLRVADRDVAHYQWAPDLPRESAPRPYLHPVRTLAGRIVTGARLDGYPHHLGISVAVQSVAGHNFWGGRTYLAGHGPTWLDNHGTQRHDRWLQRTATDLRHTLRWTGADQTVLLREERSIRCRPVDETAWSLTLGTRLTNATGHPLDLRSPAVEGRVGAGYGGFFWQAPAGSAPAGVFSASASGFAALHGRTADWLAVTPGDQVAAWSMVFLPGDETTARDPWHLRYLHYAAVGSALSWDTPLTLAPGETIERCVITVVADGIVPVARAAELAALARAAQ
jgi:hypothetical protein